MMEEEKKQHGNFGVEVDDELWKKRGKKRWLVLPTLRCRVEKEF